MKEKMKEEKINDALLKVALGYQVAEVTEEYAEVDGELKLTKRKKTKKDIPPDLKAVQLLLSVENDESYCGWTDEQLQAEKERLLAELQEQQQKTGKTQKKKSEVDVKGTEEGKEEKAALEEQTEEGKTVAKRTVKTKKVAGSVELNVKSTRPKPRKRVVKKEPQTEIKKHLKE